MMLSITQEELDNGLKILVSVGVLSVFIAGRIDAHSAKKQRQEIAAKTVKAVDAVEATTVQAAEAAVHKMDAIHGLVNGHLAEVTDEVIKLRAEVAAFKSVFAELPQSTISKAKKKKAKIGASNAG